MEQGDGWRIHDGGTLDWLAILRALHRARTHAGFI